MGTVIQHSTQLCLPRPSSPLSSSQPPSGAPSRPTLSPHTPTCPPPMPTPTASRTTPVLSTSPPMSTGTALQLPAPTRWLSPMAGPRPSPTPLDWKDTWLRCHTMVRHSTLSMLPLQSRPPHTRPPSSTTLPSSTTPLLSTTPLCTTLPQSTMLPLFTPPPPPLSRLLLRRLAPASPLP